MLTDGVREFLGQPEPEPEPAAPKDALPRALAENDLIKTESGETYRLLRALRGADDPEGSLPQFAIVILVDGRPAMPKRWSFAELVNKVRSGALQKLPVQCRDLGSANPNPSDKAAEDRRWNLIESLVKDDTIFEERGRSKRVDEHARACQVSPQTITAALLDYWRGGQTRAALQTKYAKGAAKRVAAMQAADCEADSLRAEREQAAKSAGRRLKDGSAPYRLAGKERAKVRKLAVEFFNKNRNLSLRAIHDDVIKALYSCRDDKGLVYQLPNRQCPSVRQVSRLINEALSLEAKIRRETSDNDFENNSRAKTGTHLSQTHGAGSVYEIDATIVDLWIVHRDNRHKIIGKATLYLVADRYTRLIVGFHLTLDPPSWAGAMEALLSTVADKQALCKRYNAEYIPEVWLASGVVCHFLATDRGSENIGNDSERLPAELGINVDTLPRCRAPLKGIIECSFRLIHVSLRDNAAGYADPATAKKRQSGKEYEKDAQLTLDELAAEVIGIINLHNRRFHTDMALDGELITQGVRAIPIEVWKADVERRSGMLKKQDEAFMRRMLLPRGKAKVTQKGICFDGCFYESSKAHREGWFIKGGKLSKFKIDVMYDRRCINQILVVPPDSNDEPFVAELTGASLLYKNYSWNEFKSLMETKVKNNSGSDEHDRNLRINHSRNSEARGKKADKLRKEAAARQPGVSRTSGAKDLRTKEAAERAAEETAKAFSALDTGDATRTPSDDPVEVSSAQVAQEQERTESVQHASEAIAKPVLSGGEEEPRTVKPEINPYASAQELLDQLF